MKILHIATDEKFIDHAFPVFEKVYPGQNHVFIFTTQTSLKYVKLVPERIESVRKQFFANKGKIGKDIYAQYDLVVFHSLTDITTPELKNVPKSIPTVWLGWGFDYYRDLLHDVPLYLESTQTLYNKHKYPTASSRMYSLMRGIAIKLYARKRKRRALEKLELFCPVLPKEYEMIKKSRRWRRFPDFAVWNYGTMEDNFVKGFESEVVSGDAILIGNSATYTGNHLEAFKLLTENAGSDRKIIVPLSYGNPQLAQDLASLGCAYFSDNFEPLNDFLPIDKYVSVIKSCGFVIMNHVRQQAVGNIVIMLYLGARVFLREENPTYKFLIDLGITVSTVQELETNPHLLSTPLNEIERDTNKRLVSEYWGRETAYKRTKLLVETALRDSTTLSRKELTREH